METHSQTKTPNFSLVDLLINSKLKESEISLSDDNNEELTIENGISFF